MNNRPHTMTKQTFVKRIITVSIILVTIASFSHCECNGYNSIMDVPDFEWAKRLGGASLDYGYALAVDSGKHIIVAGSVLGDVDLNGDGDSTDTNENAGVDGSANMVIVKYTMTGNLLWSKRFGNGTSCSITGLAVDSSDNIIISGYVNGDIDINGETSTGHLGNDAVLLKLNSNGSTIWLKRLGGDNSDLAYAVAVDRSNNIILTGLVNGAADLSADGDTSDDGEGTGSVYGGDDVFISKFSSSGTYAWSKRLGGSNSEQRPYVTTDSNNNVIVSATTGNSGTFNSTADLNGDDVIDGTNPETPLGTQGYTDIILSKFTQDGTHIWAHRIGGNSGTLFEQSNTIVTDNADNIILTAVVVGIIDIDEDENSPSVLDAEDSTGYGGADIILVKMSSAGTVLWAKRLGGTSDDFADANYGGNVSVYGSGSILLAVEVVGDADVDGNGYNTDGGAESSAGIYGLDDIIITEFSSDGTHIWARRLGGTGDDYAGTLFHDEKYLFLTGFVTGDADLNGDGDTGDSAETPIGTQANSDIFLTIFELQ